VDPSNLENIISVIQRGYTYDHKTVEAYWQQNNLTDYKLFGRLVSIFSGALTMISEENLRMLLVIGDKDLALETLHSFKPAEDKSNSPYFVAAWKLYRLCRATSKLDTKNMHLEIESKRIPLLRLLLWASKNAINMTNVEENATELNRLLLSDLCACTASILQESAISQNKQKDIINLWSFMFAPLLRVGDGGIPLQAAFVIAKNQYPPTSSWDISLKDLCHLWFGTCTPEIADRLCNNLDFKKYITSSIIDSSDFNRIIVNLLKVSPLIVDWQIFLLTSDLLLPDILMQDVFLRGFEKALKLLKSNESQLKLKSNNFKTELEKHRQILFNEIRDEKTVIDTPKIKASDLGNHILFVIDISGSMTEAPFPTNPVIKAKHNNRFGCVLETIRNMEFKENTNKIFSLIGFNNVANIVVMHKKTLIEITNALIMSILGGGTDFDNAIIKIEEVLSKPLPGFAHTVIFLSDGEGTCTKKENIQKFISNYERFVMHTVLIGDKKGEKELLDMAELGGGQFFYAKLTLKDIMKQFEDITKFVQSNQIQGQIAPTDRP
jgi:hypothetical protein